MKDLFNKDKNRSAIFRNYIIYVDGISEAFGFVPSQKLNSFFGQIGVYEGHDRIINYFEWLLKINDSFYFIFKQSPDYESEQFELDMTTTEKIFLSFQNIYNSKQEITFDQIFNISEEKQEEKQEEDQEEDQEENNIVFFVPLSILFYYGEKKIDFFFTGCLRKNYYFFRQKYINCFNYLRYKQKQIYKLENFLVYSLLNNYHFLFNMLNKFYKNNNFFYTLLNKASLDFFKNDNFLFPVYKQFLEHFTSKRSRIFIFKKFLNKKIFSLTSNLKEMKWFDSSYLLDLAIYKYTWFVNKFKHTDITNSIFCFVSQLNSIKKKFLKRFKRRKRYKKFIVRDYFGKKYFYEKFYNIIEENKKKKKK